VQEKEESEEGRNRDKKVVMVKLIIQTKTQKNKTKKTPQNKKPD
jgi:hypothetical protein